MHKPKKVHTESGRQNKRSLRISESPKRITKLRLGVLLQQEKEAELQQINQAVRKIGQQGQSVQKYNYNPYEAGFDTDMQLWREYCQATERYEHAGISLRWPYSFNAARHQNDL